MSAKFAPVCPPRLYRSLKEAGDFVLGRYHLLLAHDVAEQDREYKGLFDKSMFTIMDNSMVELGHPVERDVMKIACSIVPSSCVVLPDFRGDAKETVKRSKAAAKTYNFAERFMAVPQGRTLAEFLWCAEQLREIDKVMYYGIPRTAHEALGSRSVLTHEIYRLGTKYAKGHNNIHLLGFSSDIADDLKCARQPGVMGIDTAVITRMGQRRQLIAKNMPDPGPRGDYWTADHSKVTAETLANLYLIRNWI